MPGILAAAAIAGVAHASAAQDRPVQADVDRGRGVVVGTYARDPAGACFRCHGLDGAGIAEAAFPRLTDQYFAYLYASLKDYAEGRRPNAIMVPIAKALSDQEMRDVSAYYATRADAPYTTAPDARPAIIAQGEELARLGAPDQGISPCSNCHGHEGVGMPPAFPFLAGQHEDYLEEQLLLWKRGQRESDESGIMRHIASRLSYGQIRAVSLYYASLRPPEVTPGDVIEAPDAELPAAGDLAPIQVQGERP